MKFGLAFASSAGTDSGSALEICRRAEALGFVGDANDDALPLVIPASAPLRTGRRALVYVEVPGRKRPTYEGRVVTLGPRAGCGRCCCIETGQDLRGPSSRTC